MESFDKPPAFPYPLQPTFVGPRFCARPKRWQGISAHSMSHEGCAAGRKRAWSLATTASRKGPKRRHPHAYEIVFEAPRVEGSGIMIEILSQCSRRIYHVELEVIERTEDRLGEHVRVSHSAASRCLLEKCDRPFIFQICRGNHKEEAWAEVIAIGSLPRKKEIQCPIPSPGEPCQLFCPSCRRPLIIQRRLTREEWSQTSKQRSPPSPTAPLALPSPQPIGSACSTAPLSSPTHSQPTGSASSTSPPPPLSLPAPPPQEQHKGTIKVTWHNSGYIVQDVFFVNAVIS